MENEKLNNVIKPKKVCVGSIVDLFIENKLNDDIGLNMGFLSDKDTEKQIIPGIPNIYINSELGKLLLRMHEDETIELNDKNITVINVFENYQDFKEKSFGRTLNANNDINTIGIGSVVDLIIDGRNYTACIVDSEKFEMINGVQEIQVNSPLGNAIIGHCESETINYKVMTDSHSATILNIYKNV